jgi:succinate dehydrogenase / fumarate reductase membrane anchor subunit
MKNMKTPLHRVKGLGSSHSGTGHFWHERVSSVALIPLTLWFGYAMLGLLNASPVAAIGFLAHPWNALLMAGFVTVTLYHIRLGLQVILDDYVHATGTRIALLLLVRFVVIATWAVCIFALMRIASF